MPPSSLVTSMPLPTEVRSHHTVWVRTETMHPVSVRYSVDSDRLVCFGDGQLRDVPSGTRVWASVHEIAHGPPLVSFPALLRQVDADAVDTNAVVELLDHISLGRTSTEVARALDAHRHRRILELVPLT
jgi:hypothetical protein